MCCPLVVSKSHQSPDTLQGTRRRWMNSVIIFCPQRVYGFFSFPVAQAVKKKKKNLPAMQETQVWSLGLEDSLEKRMATSILAWRTPWTEKPGGLQSTGSWRVSHHWETNTTLKRFKPMLLLRKTVIDRKLAKPIFIKEYVIESLQKTCYGPNGCVPCKFIWWNYISQCDARCTQHHLRNGQDIQPTPPTGHTPTLIYTRNKLTPLRERARKHAVCSHCPPPLPTTATGAPVKLWLNFLSLL